MLDISNKNRAVCHNIRASKTFLHPDKHFTENGTKQ